MVAGGGAGSVIVYFVFNKGDRCGQICFQKDKDNYVASWHLVAATVQEAGSPLKGALWALSSEPAGCSQEKIVADNQASPSGSRSQKEMSVPSGRK